MRHVIKWGFDTPVEYEMEFLTCLRDEKPTEEYVKRVFGDGALPWAAARDFLGRRDCSSKPFRDTISDKGISYIEFHRTKFRRLLRMTDKPKPHGPGSPSKAESTDAPPVQNKSALSDKAGGK